jgi:hypothetical protein
MNEFYQILEITSRYHAMNKFNMKSMTEEQILEIITLYHKYFLWKKN